MEQETQVFRFEVRRNYFSLTDVTLDSGLVTGTNPRDALQDLVSSYAQPSGIHNVYLRARSGEMLGRYYVPQGELTAVFEFSQQ